MGRGHGRPPHRDQDHLRPDTVRQLLRENSLCFSLYLMAYPPEAIEYVVVHELCHLYEFNHSPGFWRMVESVLPDYEQWKRWLAQHGQNL